MLRTSRLALLRSTRFAAADAAVGEPWPNWIEAMNEHDTHVPPPVPEQIDLLERDTGLLCRILGLYASRGIDVQRADYAFAAPGSGPLKAATIEWAP
jgi:hypothetical protein